MMWLKYLLSGLTWFYTDSFDGFKIKQNLELERFLLSDRHTPKDLTEGVGVNSEWIWDCLEEIFHSLSNIDTGKEVITRVSVKMDEWTLFRKVGRQRHWDSKRLRGRSDCKLKS